MWQRLAARNRWHGRHDRYRLTDPNDAAIDRTIIALDQSLGISMISEEVEIKAQRDLQAGVGCHDYQGYLPRR